MLFPVSFITLLAPRKIEPTPIIRVKNIDMKPINSPENQACCDAKGWTSLLANVSMEKFGESNIPVRAKEKVKTIEAVHVPL